ncbi:hypothetical protein RvY_04237 [Ramazzottius varieornatus]|uniref:Uncharacterized protein n=1 Tax=Ramazzottius varieornatus TaxID=947166 RepID=A0A1D1UWQ5_RAMVA|nr:hypothetical protein RvY_04237 [Ramazzottius varieornatus]
MVLEFQTADPETERLAKRASRLALLARRPAYQPFLGKGLPAEQGVRSTNTILAPEQFLQITGASACQRPASPKLVIKHGT